MTSPRTTWRRDVVRRRDEELCQCNISGSTPGVSPTHISEIFKRVGSSPIGGTGNKDDEMPPIHWIIFEPSIPFISCTLVGLNPGRGVVSPFLKKGTSA